MVKFMVSGLVLCLAGSLDLGTRIGIGGMLILNAGLPVCVHEKRQFQEGSHLSLLSQVMSLIDAEMPGQDGLGDWKMWLHGQGQWEKIKAEPVLPGLAL